MIWIDRYIDEYYHWLRTKTKVSIDPNTEWVAITTPHTGLFNDYIEIYAHRNRDKSITLTDDGDTLRNLEMIGVTLDQRSTRRTDWLNAILLNHGVTKTDNNELMVTAYDGDFNQKKYNLISAILETSEMETLAKPNVSSIFRDDIREYLDNNNIAYTVNIGLIGEAKLNHNIDFFIAGKECELIVKPFSNIHTHNLSAFLFAYDDIKKVREQQTRKAFNALAIINDDKEVPPPIMDALHIKEIESIMWSNRNNPAEVDKVKIAV